MFYNPTGNIPDRVVFTRIAKVAGMHSQLSGYDQLQADDVAMSMSRVQAQITWCLKILSFSIDNPYIDPDFHDALAKEALLLEEYWQKLRSARNRIVGDDAVAF